jgi:hypothetical protein
MHPDQRNSTSSWDGWGESWQPNSSDGVGRGHGITGTGTGIGTGPREVRGTGLEYALEAGLSWMKSRGGAAVQRFRSRGGTGPGAGIGGFSNGTNGVPSAGEGSDQAAYEYELDEGRRSG